MAEGTFVPWRTLVNGVGSALIAYLVVILLALFVTGPVGPIGTAALFVGGAVLAIGLYTFFGRL